MRKSTLSIIIGSLIGLVLIVLWLNSVDFSILVQSFREVNYSLVIIAGLFYILAYVVRSYRWNLLLRNQVLLSIKESWMVASAGNWLNYLIPIRAGEIIKALLIKKLRKKTAVSIMPSIFLDKFFDTLGIFFVLLLLPFIRLHVSPGLRILIILLIFMFVIAFTILILAATHKGKITFILQKLFAWLPIRIRNKIYHLIELFINGLNIFDHQLKTLFYAVLLTAIGIMFDGLYFYMIFRAFNQNIGFVIILFGYTLINLSYVLPQPPAQLGSNEWMMIIIFSLGFGLTHNTASAIMVFAHVFTACIISILGIIGFSYAGVKSYKQIRKELS
jgi:glycosyltransferase 2 family protein